MATVASPRKASRARPFTCSFVSITIEISDTRYAVDPIAPGEDGTRAYRLSKHSGDHAVYDVIRTHSGTVECSCPDYEARRRGTAGVCKHGRALVELGLMTGPAPAPVACCAPAEVAPCVACVEAPAVEATPAPVELPGELVDPGDVESDPVLWPEGWDADVWDLGPDPDAATLDLAELVDRQAAAYRAWPLEAGEMIARELDALALKIRMTDSSTPAEFEARAGSLEADARSQWEAIGHEQGRMSCPCHSADGLPSAFGHIA